MRALVFRGVGAVRLETVPDPTIRQPTDAIVEVGTTAICGSDMHVWHGREAGLDDGTVMGHEFVGRVVALGSDVRGLTVGDLVMSPFTTSCGACEPCLRGLTARCVSGRLYGWVENGEGLHGAQAEYVRVSLAASTLVPVPDGVTADEALLLGDVMSTGYYGAEMARVDPTRACAVVGCGPVGLMAVLGARILGAEQVHALDTVPERLDLAREFGAEPLDAGDPDALASLLDRDGGGPASVVEAVGSDPALRLAYDIVGPGGTIAAVGVHTSPGFAFTPAELYDKNVTFATGRCPARSVLERLIPTVRSQRFTPASIITHRLGLDAGAAAYELFDERRDGCVKVVLEP